VPEWRDVMRAPAEWEVLPPCPTTAHSGDAPRLEDRDEDESNEMRGEFTSTNLPLKAGRFFYCNAVIAIRMGMASAFADEKVTDSISTPGRLFAHFLA
jgi:hypothetical protein